MFLSYVKRVIAQYCTLFKAMLFAGADPVLVPPAGVSDDNAKVQAAAMNIINLAMTLPGLPIQLAAVMVRTSLSDFGHILQSLFWFCASVPVLAMCFIACFGHVLQCLFGHVLQCLFWPCASMPVASPHVVFWRGLVPASWQEALAWCELLGPDRMPSCTHHCVSPHGV